MCKKVAKTAKRSLHNGDKRTSMREHTYRLQKNILDKTVFVREARENKEKAK